MLGFHKKASTTQYVIIDPHARYLPQMCTKEVVLLAVKAVKLVNYEKLSSSD